MHDASSVLAMATNTRHNGLCITLNLFKNLRLRIAIVRSAWRQPNISKHTSTVSCDLVLKIFLNVLAPQIKIHCTGAGSEDDDGRRLCNSKQTGSIRAAAGGRETNRPYRRTAIYQHRGGLHALSCRDDSSFSWTVETVIDAIYHGLHGWTVIYRQQRALSSYILIPSIASNLSLRTELLGSRTRRGGNWQSYRRRVAFRRRSSAHYERRGGEPFFQTQLSKSCCLFRCTRH